MYDVAILGAGPVGIALALLLAQQASQPERILLLASDRPAAGAPACGPDPRTLALNHGSRMLLEPLGAWPASAADIHTVHVSQKGRLGRTLIQASELHVPRLGSVLTYSDLQDSLLQALEASRVTVHHGVPATVGLQDNDGVSIQQGEQHYRAALAVRADGLPGEPIPSDNAQHAILTLARATLPRLGWAWERFTRSGPLALLPHPAGPAVHAVVWCLPASDAQRIAHFDDTHFSEELTRHFGTRLGRLEVMGSRATFPLAPSHAAQLRDGRALVIGNAAQTLHPVAGQGLNLGLRDAARLAQSLAPWLQGRTGALDSALQEYEAAREPDRELTIRLTGLLPRIFSTQTAVVEHASGAGLLALDLLPALRAPLARHLLQGLRT
ncbi:monooxygenase [Bordetella sp. J329]|uniref:FAD-dependent monooxygenase n=1 Tax=Kerstersia gyiorum TaxID=206506 RepID=UPI000FD6D6F8|nr:FAD-dependent monooxygenase [Kerstersia gyiorum]AZV92855.1 monooxygenase [Bordetella sp. J329]QBR39828.1 monooxygenase [Kerstersia gyiorum]